MINYLQYIIISSFSQLDLYNSNKKNEKGGKKRKN